MSTTIVGTPPTQPEARPSIRRLRRGQIIGGVLLLALLIVVILAAFGEPLWQLLGTGILLLSVAVVVLLALGTLVITLVIAAVTRRRTRVMPWLHRLLRLFFVLLILLVGVASTLRQRNAYDRMGGKSEREELIDAKASDSSHPE